jgi:AraC-like DNA-binding protein
MLVAKTDLEFRRVPEGGFVFGEGWLYFCLDEHVYGFVLWGAPTTAGIRALVRVLELELARPPHAAFVDVRALASISTPAFSELLAYVARHSEELRRVVTHVSIVRGDGLLGATVTGFLDIASSPFPAKYFATPAIALDELGVARAEEISVALDAARDHASGIPAVLRDLAAYVECHLTDATIERSARALAMSTRTLQRRLAEAGTSFVNELQNARVNVARRLLEETTDSLTSIAANIGCASPQHFSSLFRKRVGITPTAFRGRSRRA